jgi:hypothetical protein
MRAALYLRVSTSDQDTARQERELRTAAAAREWDIVQVYADNGISGAKGRDKRPGFDALHRGAVQGKFDVVMAWSVDRLGRSLQHLSSGRPASSARHDDRRRQCDVPDVRRFCRVRAGDDYRAREVRSR